MKYKNFTEMEVWQNAMDLAVSIFSLTVDLPKKEDYGLTSQIRRSAESISANIAEGFGKGTPKDKARFYDIAKGSAYETQSHLLYGRRVGYFGMDQVENLNVILGQIVLQVNKLKKSLNG